MQSYEESESAPRLVPDVINLAGLHKPGIPTNTGLVLCFGRAPRESPLATPSLTILRYDAGVASPVSSARMASSSSISRCWSAITRSANAWISGWTACSTAVSDASMAIW